MLCNKADREDAEDEVHVVNDLNVERLVNAAKCPTRVEPSVATKNHGLKDGFKWLVKSIIANMSELGPRVDKDVEEERKIEAEKRAEIRRRIEERKAQEENEGGTTDLDRDDDKDANGEPPGFVPINELTSKLEAEAKTATPQPPNGEVTEIAEEPTIAASENVAAPPPPVPEPEVGGDSSAAKTEIPGTVEQANPAPKLPPPTAPSSLPPLKSVTVLPTNNHNNSSRRNSSSNKSIRSGGSGSRRGSQVNGVEKFLKNGTMDLEPTVSEAGLKRIPFGGRRPSQGSKPSSSKSNSSAGSRRR